MRNIRFFEEGFRFYKGNLHSHTTSSDGSLTAEQAALKYRGAGYHFLCITEHEQFTARTELGDTDFLILPAVEWSSVLRDGNRPVKCHHVLGIEGTRAMLAAAAKPPLRPGDRLPPLPYDGVATARRMCRELNDRGCMAVYNHPLWSRVTPADFGLLDGFAAMEIHNYSCELEDFTGFAEVYWDQLLSMGSRVRGVSTDDNHNKQFPDDSCGGWVQVYAQDLTQDHIVTSLINGQFYASSGPEIIRYGIEDGVCYVECSPCRQIHFVSGGQIHTGSTLWSRTDTDDLTRAEHRLSGKEGYIRIRCQRRDGKTAWTNALFLEEISHFPAL
jgi:hypothetical protein